MFDPTDALSALDFPQPGPATAGARSPQSATEVQS
jgi:hypothetical protein